MRRSALAALAIAAAMLGCASPASAAVVGPITWQPPVMVHPLVNPAPGTGLPSVGGLAAISCPSASLCVSLDNAGNVVTSTDPTGGAGAWITAHIETHTEEPCHLSDCNGHLTGVDCPSTSLCVVWDNLGYVFVSADPAGGATTWTASKVAGPYGVIGLDCPTTTLCVGVQGQTVLTTTNPLAGASSWHNASVDFPACPENATPVHCRDRKLLGTGFMAIDCPAASLCVAVDNEGDIVTSTEPTAGGSAWLARYLDTERVAGPLLAIRQAILLGITCPTASACIATDNGGNVLTSNEPTGGAPAWTLSRVFNWPPDLNFGHITCASLTRCIGRYSFDTRPVPETTIWVDTNYATFAGGGWAPTAIAREPVPKAGGFPYYPEPGNIACPSVRLCIATDEAGDMIVGRAEDLSRARLARLVAAGVSGRRSFSIRALLGGDSFGLPYTPPVIGAVTVRWLTRGGVHHHARRVASGTYVFRDLAQRTISMQLTGFGRRALRHHRRLRVHAQIVFAASGERPVTATAGVRLRA